MPHRRTRPPWVLFALALALALGCRNRASKAALEPPPGTAEFENRFAIAFDDLYTAAEVPLAGRAPHDVTDQRLFQSRMGHASLVLRVTVTSAWSERRYAGHAIGFLEVEIEDVLVGELGPRVRRTQVIPVRNPDPLPPSVVGQSLLWFVRWAPGEQPPYHHHLVPGSGGLEELAQAMARDAPGRGTGKRKRGRGGKKTLKVKAGGSADDRGGGEADTGDHAGEWAPSEGEPEAESPAQGAGGESSPSPAGPTDAAASTTSPGL